MSVREAVARPFALAGARTWRFPLFVGAVVLTVTALPYLVGAMFAHGDRQFMGIASDVPDTTQYFAWMRAFAHTNGLLIANPLTPEPNDAAFFNLLWYVLGHIGAFLHLQPAVTYQGFRWVAGAGFFAALWAACGVFCAPGWERRLGWLLVVLGGGFGWIWVILKYVIHHPVPPLDIYIAEPNSFFALIGFPHLLFAATLLIGIFLLFVRGYERGSWASYIGAGAAGLFLGVTHAYDLLVVYTVLCVFALAMTVKRRVIPWQTVGGIAIIGGLSSPPALYFTYLTQHDATWRGVLAQYTNAGIVTPSPLHLAILLGPVFLVALLTVFLPDGWRALRVGPDRDLLIVVWFLASFLLVYLPTSYQIKMLNGWQIPAGVLAARGVARIIAPWMRGRSSLFRNRLARVPVGVIVGVALLLLAIPTNLYLVGWRSDEVHRATAPYSLSAGDANALQWLGEHAGEGDIVLSSLTVGQYVAGMSDARPVLAHWAQTLRYYEKEDAISRFYNATTPEAERLDLLRQWNVRFVVAGPEERALGTYDPGRSAQYVQVYASGRTMIYAVRSLAASAEGAA